MTIPGKKKINFCFWPKFDSVVIFVFSEEDSEGSYYGEDEEFEDIYSENYVRDRYDHDADDSYQHVQIEVILTIKIVKCYRKKWSFDVEGN